MQKELDELGAKELERQHFGFQSHIATMADESIKALTNSQAPIIIAGDIFQAALIFRGKLEESFKTAPTNELKTIAATLVVQLGSHVGVEHLLHAINADETYSGLAANSLSKVGIKEAIPEIITRLYRYERKHEDVKHIESYISSLKCLGGELPADLKERFAGVENVLY